MLHSYGNGLVIALGLIMAIGAQNAFVLSQALRREHHLWVAGVCVFFDVLLVACGVYGLAQLLISSPVLLLIARWGGVLFLSCYGALALRRAFRKNTLEAAAIRPAQSLQAVVMTTLAVTLLNPHVYLDTVIMLGAISGNCAGSGRYFFGLGAVTASILWFFSLAKGGTMLAPVFAKPRAWQVLNILVCAMVWLVASGLAYGVWQELAVIPSLSAALAY